MIKTIFIFSILLLNLSYAQQSLNFFIDKAKQNSPVLHEYTLLQNANKLQRNLNEAENSAFQFSLSGDYHFVPYFNNNGKLITTNPSPDAYGYDIGLTDGGLYSAQFNLERNFFNGGLLNALDEQTNIQNRDYQLNINLEQHNLEKQVTDQYITARHALQLMQLRQETVSNIRMQLKLTKEMVEKGFAGSQDYLLLKIELKNQEINTNDAQNQYHNDLLQLYSLCGISDTTFFEIMPAELNLNRQTGSSNFVRKYKLDSLRLVNNQELFETKYIPQLKFFANAGLNAVELNRLEHRFGMSAGLSLSMAIFDGNQKSLTRQQNIINQQNITEYRRYAMNNIRLQRINLESRINAQKKNIDSMDVQIADYKNLLDISENQLHRGNISMIDYLTLLRNFNDLKERQIELETNYKLEINNYNYWNW